jgi:hypothetical protein
MLPGTASIRPYARDRSTGGGNPLLLTSESVTSEQRRCTESQEGSRTLPFHCPSVTVQT